MYSGKVLDDPSFCTSRGTRDPAVPGQSGGLNQEWKIVALSDGNYQVENAYSDLVPGRPRSATSNGVNIDQCTLNGAAPTRSGH